MRGKAFWGLGDAARFKSLRYRAGVLLIPFLAPLLAFAQTDPDAPIMRAYAFVQHDQPASARALIRRL